MLQAFAKLTALSEERGKAYANAVARVSLEGTFSCIIRTNNISRILSVNRLRSYSVLINFHCVVTFKLTYIFITS